MRCPVCGNRLSKIGVSLECTYCMQVAYQAYVNCLRSVILLINSHPGIHWFYKAVLTDIFQMYLPEDRINHNHRK